MNPTSLIYKMNTLVLVSRSWGYTNTFSQIAHAASPPGRLCRYMAIRIALLATIQPAQKLPFRVAVISSNESILKKAEDMLLEAENRILSA